MKNLSFTILVFLIIFFACKQDPVQSDRPGQEPEESIEAGRFFGVHYDTHVQEGWRDFGVGADPERVARMLDEVRPDYIQISCKGHPGYAIYPTKIQEGPETLAKDVLRIWRDETAKRNIGLYMHFSGILDDWVVRKHPDWAALDPEGNPYSPENKFFSPTSIFSPYVDEYFIPQLKELVDDYNVDGVWIDGDCWGMTWDYSEMSINRFKEQTGITSVPRSMDDPDFPVFAKFCREEYRKYCAHYIEELKEYAPDFKLLNSGYCSARMPEFGTLDFDYLSIDEPTTLVRRGGMPYRETSTINFSRFDGRVLANQDTPWDILVWAFYNRNHRTASQLKQDAAVINAMGGGSMMYFSHKRDGAIPDESIPILSEVSKFCRDRQPYNYMAKSVPQIGMIMPSESVYRLLKRPFELDDDGELQFFKGLLFGLIEAQQVVDIVLMDPLFRIDPNDYPLMVLANWEFLMEEQKEELLAYVEKGGNLLIIGPQAADHFNEALDIEWSGDLVKQSNGIPVIGQMADLYTWSRTPEPGEQAEPLMRYYPDFKQTVFQYADYTPFEKVAATVTSHGEGRIAACYIDIGSDYYSFRSYYTREILRILVKELFPEPMVEVSGSDYVDVTLNKKNGNVNLHLVNTAGPHAQRDVYIYHDIPAVGPLKVRLRLNKRPVKLTLQPSRENIDFEYRDGIVYFEIDKLEIYDIVLIEV